MKFKYIKAIFDYKFILFILLNIFCIDSLFLLFTFCLIFLYNFVGTTNLNTNFSDIDIYISYLMFLIIIVLKFCPLIWYYKNVYPTIKNPIIEDFFYNMKCSWTFKIKFLVFVLSIIIIIPIIQWILPNGFVTKYYWKCAFKEMVLLFKTSIIPSYIVLFIYMWLEDKIRKIKGEKTFKELLDIHMNKRI